MQLIQAYLAKPEPTSQGMAAMDARRTEPGATKSGRANDTNVGRTGAAVGRRVLVLRAIESRRGRGISPGCEGGARVG